MEEREIVQESGCEEGWIDIGDKCIILPPEDDGKTDYYEATNLCRDTYGGSLVEWSNYGEYAKISILLGEYYIETGLNRRSWISAKRTEVIEDVGQWHWSSDDELAFVDADPRYWSGKGEACDRGGFVCALFAPNTAGLGKLMNMRCEIGGWIGEYSFCQKYKNKN